MGEFLCFGQGFGVSVVNCWVIFDNMELYERNSCVHSYHIYKDIWDAVIGEKLLREREPDNRSNRYAVAVNKDGIIIGHLPRKISRACYLFLRRGDEITCRVTEQMCTWPPYYFIDLIICAENISCLLFSSIWASDENFWTVNYSGTTVLGLSQNNTIGIDYKQEALHYT